MPLFKRMRATATASDWTCMYGDHLIPAGEPYIAVSYSKEHWNRGEAITDDSGTIFYACMQHAPSEDEVIAALRSAGMPVKVSQ